MGDKDKKCRAELSLSKAERVALCEVAAGFDKDILSFLSEICRDIARVCEEDNEQGGSYMSVDQPLYHLKKYMNVRFHTSDDGFLSNLLADDYFMEAVDTFKNASRADESDPRAILLKEEPGIQRLKDYYELYHSELQEDADTTEAAMEKLKAACEAMEKFIETVP